MNALIILLSTMGISISLEMMNELSIFKDIANRGYKIDMNKISKYTDKKKQTKYLLNFLIPGVNIAKVIERMHIYEKGKTELYSKLDQMDMFVKMTEEEYEKYLDNPSSVTALNMAIDVNIKTEENKKEPPIPQGFIKISNGTYRHEYNDGTYYEIKFKKENNKIIVTSLEGKIKDLDKDKQQEIIDGIFRTLYKQKAYIQEEKSEITNQKEQLIAHRNEILELQQQQEEQVLKLK